MAAIGVVTGLAAEARCLPAGIAQVVRSGGRPAQARAGAEALLEAGAAALVSFGLAGGLDPALRPGMLLLPERVLAGDQAWPVAADWRARWLALAAAAGVPAIGGSLTGSDRLLADPAAKRALFATGAGAVDMESHAVAAVASAAGRPFMVLRAIADPAASGLPRAAAVALDADGRIRLLPVLAALLREPWSLPALIHLGRQSGRGLATLRRVAALGGAAFALA